MSFTCAPTKSSFQGMISGQAYLKVILQLTSSILLMKVTQFNYLEAKLANINAFITTLRAYYLPKIFVAIKL
jgi:hypothetical protein